MASRPLDASATSFMSGSAFTSVAIPPRRRGWSSTARIRINREFVHVISLASRQPQSGFHTGWFVCDCGRQLQLNLRPGAVVAPHVQSCADSIGTFTHAAYSPVSGAFRRMQALRVDARPIIANAQAKHLVVVANLRLNPAGACVSKCISNQLASDSTDFVVQTWREDVNLSFHGHPERREF